MESEKKVVNVYTESNPNPNSLKFCVEFLLFQDNKSMDFPDIASAIKSPIATDLFKFSFVRRVFISANFITITKGENDVWDDIVPILKAYIKNYLEEGRPLILEEVVTITDENEPEIVTRIKILLDEYVRPAVEQDGGAINFHSFEENTGLVKVQLQGSCSGCPSSTMTLKAGIENLLTRMIPEVKQVVAEGV